MFKLMITDSPFFIKLFCTVLDYKYLKIIDKIKKIKFKFTYIISNSINAKSACCRQLC